MRGRHSCARRSDTRMALAQAFFAAAPAKNGLWRRVVAVTEIAAPAPLTPIRDTEADPMTNLNTVRARFAQSPGLPFADVLTEARIRDALDEHEVEYRDRVFGPVTTIWGFLSQVLSEDHSCRDAVARVIAHRTASGLGPCSPNTASYCNARGRIPTAVLRDLAKRTAGELQAGTPERWNWNGRRVFIADGSHVSMPDTTQNQVSYPQP